MKIYGISLSTVEKIPLEVTRDLMPERYDRSLKYLHKEDRLRCLGAGLLLHHVLGVEERELKFGSYGKPYVAENTEFSLSHGGNWAVLSADSRPVGVDIEPISPENLEVACHVFTERELLWMEAEPLTRFHVLWTLKESIMKATGLGLQLEPIRFEVDPDSNVSTVHGKSWYTAWMLHDNCAVACAAETPVENMEFAEISFTEIVKGGSV